MSDDEKADIIEIRNVLEGIQVKISELEKKIQENYYNLKAKLIHHHVYLHGTKDLTQCNDVEESITYKISELEKKLKQVRISQFGKPNRIRIEKLEKHIMSKEVALKLIDDVEKLEKDLNEHAVFTTPEEYEGIKKELSELKASIKNVKDGIVNNAECYNELKEQVDRVGTDHNERIIDIKEVLRDIMNVLRINDLMSTEYYNNEISKLEGGEKSSVRNRSGQELPNRPNSGDGSKPPNHDEYRSKPIEERRKNYEARMTKDGVPFSRILEGIDFKLNKEKPPKCKYWEEGHKIMNCRMCEKPNMKFCKKTFGSEDKE